MDTSNSLVIETINLSKAYKEAVSFTSSVRSSNTER